MLKNYKSDTTVNVYQMHAFLKIAVLFFKDFNPHPTRQIIL